MERIEDLGVKILDESAEECDHARYYNLHEQSLRSLLRSCLSPLETLAESIR